MSRTFTAIAGLAALIALSTSAATADENPYSANSMLPACMAVLAISSGNRRPGRATLALPLSGRWRSRGVGSGGTDAPLRGGRDCPTRASMQPEARSMAQP